jgi:hypothetical protein
MIDIKKVVSANITISNRNFDMIDKLRPQYTEGAAFHLYHSIESIATAGIMARTKKKPDKNHKHRIEEFHGAYSNILEPVIHSSFLELIKKMEFIIGASDKREFRNKILYYDNHRQTEPKDLLTNSDIEGYKIKWNDLRTLLAGQITKLTD